MRFRCPFRRSGGTMPPYKPDPDSTFVRFPARVPGEVLRSCDLPVGGNWEAGATDRSGDRWIHVPHEGWQRQPRFFEEMP